MLDTGIIFDKSRDGTGFDHGPADIITGEGPDRIQAFPASQDQELNEVAMLAPGKMRWPWVRRTLPARTSPVTDSTSALASAETGRTRAKRAAAARRSMLLAISLRPPLRERRRILVQAPAGRKRARPRPRRAQHQPGRHAEAHDAGVGGHVADREEQGGRLPDTVLVSVGGGGLIGGVAAWVESRAHVVALEPERAPTLHAARAAGQPVDVEVGGIAADSLGARRIGAIGWEVSQRHVHDALLLPDDAIRAAQLWLWKELKLAVEPAAALGLAALQTGVYRPQPQETVALILCGANFDPAGLA